MTAIFLLSLRRLPAGKTQLEFDQELCCLPEQATRPLVEVLQTLFSKGLHFYLKGEKSYCTNPRPLKRFCWTSTAQHQHGNRKSTEFRASHRAIAALWSFSFLMLYTDFQQSCHLLPFQGESKATFISEHLGFKRLSFQLLCFQSHAPRGSHSQRTPSGFKGTGLLHN